jgi:hypothetical protein
MSSVSEPPCPMSLLSVDLIFLSLDLPCVRVGPRGCVARVRRRRSSAAAWGAATSTAGTPPARRASPRSCPPPPAASCSQGHKGKGVRKGLEARSSK